MLPDMQERDSPYLKPTKFDEWYSLNYFVRGQRLWQHKLWLLGVPIGLSVLWLAVEWLHGNGWAVFQSGPVIAAHRDFNNECSRCHTQHFQVGKRFQPWQTELHTTPDQGCVECHRAA